MSWSLLVVVAVLQAAALSAIMSAAYFVRRATGKSGWIDFSWSAGVGSVGVLSALAYFTGAGISSRQWLVAGLAGLWSARLAGHIAIRTLRGQDDPRYAALARQWGADVQRRMYLFAQSQAVAAIPLVVSIFVAAQRPTPALGLQDVMGALILAIAIVGEGVADAQLRRYSTDPAHKCRVCDQGLWRWSRHPNYFFQWLGWAAYPVIAIDVTGGYVWGWLTIAAPLLMYWLLVKVSGIPPLETHMLETRGKAFSEYQQRTSAFFPRPPRTQA